MTWLFCVSRGLPALVVAALAAGCGAAFAPPTRIDLDFAGSRVAAGAPELQFGVATPDGGTAQVTYRHLFAEGDSVELFALDHGKPGDRSSFLLGGVGYRRHLSEAQSLVQATLGFGAGAGIGGNSRRWRAEDAHLPPALAGYVDVGVSVRLLPTLVAYGGGRLQRAVSLDDHEDTRPPATDWLHMGAGLRASSGPWFVSFDMGYATFENAVDRHQGVTFGAAGGVRFDAP